MEEQEPVAGSALTLVSGVQRSLSAGLLAFAFLAAGSAVADGGPFFGETLVGLDGVPVPLTQLRGRPLVVNFWARWCMQCRTEMPQLSAHRARFAARGVDLVGIAVEDKPEVVQAFVKAYEIDFPVLVARQKGVPLLQALGDATSGLPYTVVFDRQGNVVFRKLGAMSAAEMDGAFGAALADRSGEAK